MLPPSMYPLSNFVSGLGIPRTSAIVFCLTTHLRDEEHHVPTCSALSLETKDAFSSHQGERKKALMLRRTWNTHLLTLSSPCDR